ncbi:antigen identified by monoclonal antibody Ki-67 [Coemansia sp. RSA 552]|nr:antigen identified by monoclonal antibody Ki-67 [Coemansia sp. RSA 552]
MDEPKHGHLVIISRSGADGKSKETCDIRIQLEAVSKEHCVIQIAGGKPELINLSENLTYVNNVAVPMGHRRVLGSGDTLTVGGRSLRYEQPRQRPAQSPHNLMATPKTLLATVPRTAPAAGRVVRLDSLRRTTTSPLTGPITAPETDVARRRMGRPALLRREVVRSALSVGGIRKRDPETARKFKRWEEHYSVSGDVSDILDESPPPGVLSSADSSIVGNGVEKDPFSAEAPATVSSFRHMEESVRRGWRSEGEKLQSEVAQIMGEISDMAQGSRRRAHTPLESSATPLLDDKPEAGRGRRRRSSSLPSTLASKYPPLIPQLAPTMPLSKAPIGSRTDSLVYGSEEETSRSTVGVSPTSSYSQSPTLQKRRSQTPAPQKRKEAARPFSSLPRQPRRTEPPLPSRVQRRNEPLSPSRIPRLNSPLRRTVSTGGTAQRSQPSSPTFITTQGSPMNSQTTPGGESSDEVPTETEMDTESEAEEPPVPVRMQTPCNNKRKRALLSQQSSTARKSVRFGPPLSPEVFESGAPPSTPLRRGTPMQIQRVSSILRMSGGHMPLMVQPEALQSLLQPRAPRRPAVFDLLARITSESASESKRQTQQPGPSTLANSSLLVDQFFDMDRASSERESVAVTASAMALPVVESTESPTASPMTRAIVSALNAAQAKETVQDTITPQRLVEPPEEDMPQTARPQLDIMDIESPSQLGSPADRRSRRRRSLSREQRRATLGAVASLDSQSPSSASPSLLVRTRAAGGDLTPSRLFQNTTPQRARDRHHRRRTAPPAVANGGFGEFGPSIAEMAAALGEDFPVALGPAHSASPSKAEKSERSEEEEEEEEPAEEPGDESKSDIEPASPSPVPLLPVSAEEPLGLADAMHLLEVGAAGSSDGSEDENGREVAMSHANASDALLREQAELQARIGGSADSSLLLQLESPEREEEEGQRQKRRQTTNFEHLRTAVGDVSDESDMAAEEILARRQRLRRQQERRRRRQTVAELKRRRSSWRGWNTAQQQLSSPPQSPEHVPSHESAGDLASRGKEQGGNPADLACSTPAPPKFGTFASQTMYPPAAWNRSSSSAFERNSEPPVSQGGRELPKRRRLTQRPDEQQFAYPPRPEPIDAGWEHVDASEIEQGDPEETSTPSEQGQELSQQVELHAVSQSPDADVTQTPEPPSRRPADEDAADNPLAATQPEEPHAAENGSQAQEPVSKLGHADGQRHRAKSGGRTPLESSGRTASRSSGRTASRSSGRTASRSSGRTTPGSRELSALSLPDIADTDRVVVGGHSLRRQADQAVKGVKDAKVPAVKDIKAPAAKDIKTPAAKDIKTPAENPRKTRPKPAASAVDVVSPMRTRSSGRKRPGGSEPSKPPAKRGRGRPAKSRSKPQVLASPPATRAASRRTKKP